MGCPKIFLDLCGEFGLADPPRNFHKLCEDVFWTLYLCDVELNALKEPYGASFLGLCSNGIDLNRLSLVFFEHFGGSSNNELVRITSAPSTTEVKRLITRVSESLLCTGQIWALSVQSRCSCEDDLDVMVDLFRCYLNHPTWYTLWQAGRSKGPSSLGLREPRVRDVVICALDAILCVMLADDVHKAHVVFDSEDQRWASLRAECVRRRPTDQAPEVLVKAMVRIPSTLFEDEDDLLVKAVEALREAIWSELELAPSDDFPVDELTPLLVFLLSRPIFGLLVRARSPHTYDDVDELSAAMDSLGHQASREVFSHAGLRATWAAVDVVQPQVGELTQKVLRVLTLDGGRSVSAEAFVAKLMQAIEGAILAHVVEVGSGLLVSKLREVLREFHPKGMPDFRSGISGSTSAGTLYSPRISEGASDGGSDDEAGNKRLPEAKASCATHWMQTSWMPQLAHLWTPRNCGGV